MVGNAPPCKIRWAGIFDFGVLENMAQNEEISNMVNGKYDDSGLMGDDFSKLPSETESIPTDSLKAVLKATLDELLEPALEKAIENLKNKGTL